MVRIALAVYTNWPERFFARLVDGYLTDSRNPGGVVGDARSYLFSARGLLRFARPVMERVAVNRPAATGLNEGTDHRQARAV